jgi:hypothetical protein
VSGDAQVISGEWHRSPTQIQGTRHFVTRSGIDTITIGCHTHTIKEWIKDYKKIGKKNNYTDEEIEEYGKYIRLICFLASRKSS